MKRIIILLILLSVSVCLFSCKKAEDNKTDIPYSPSEQVENTDIFQSNNGNEQFSPQADEYENYDFSRCFIRFKNFEEYVDWYKSGKYLSDFYVDMEGNRFGKLIFHGYRLHFGKRHLYQMYVNGEPVSDKMMVYLHQINFNVSYVYYRQDNNNNKELSSYCRVRLKYLGDSYRNTPDTVSAYKSVSAPFDINDIKDSTLMNYKGKEREVLTFSRTYEGGGVYITKSFVWEDVLVSIVYEEGSDFDLQKFLNCFELRPISLKTEKISSGK